MNFKVSDVSTRIALAFSKNIFLQQKDTAQQGTSLMKISLKISHDLGNISTSSTGQPFFLSNIQLDQEYKSKLKHKVT